MAGDDLDELLTMPDSPSHGVHVEESGIYVADHTITASTDPCERLITWAVAHAVFHMKFDKKHSTFGVIIFNHVCGFKTQEPPRVAKVISAFK